MNKTTHEFFGSFDRYQFDNGLTAFLKPIESATSLSIQTWIQAGSLYENDNNNGLSHFLEHMLFKGTEKFDGDEINSLVERAGGQQNAGTSKDYTTYYVKLPPDYLEFGLDLLGQMTFQATLPEDEFKKEREVVLSELARYQDSPNKMLWQQFIPRLYGNHPYHRLTIGQKDVLENVTHDQLLEYYNQFYDPVRSALVVAGQFDHNEALTYIEKYFGQESNADNEPMNFPPAMPPRESNQIRELPRDVEHIYGTTGTIGYPVEDDRSIALDVMMKILGGSQTSRLYENLVLERQLASSVTASFWTQRETGPVMIQFQTEQDSLDELIRDMKTEMQRLANDGINQDELNRAKTQLKTSFIYSSQTPSGQANQIGYWDTIHDINYLENYVSRLEDVTKNEIEEIAGEILIEQNWTGVLLRPESTGDN